MHVLTLTDGSVCAASPLTSQTECNKPSLLTRQSREVGLPLHRFPHLHPLPRLTSLAAFTTSLTPKLALCMNLLSMSDASVFDVFLAKTHQGVVLTFAIIANAETQSFPWFFFFMSSFLRFTLSQRI